MSREISIMTQRAPVKKGSMTYAWIGLAVIAVVAGYYIYGRGESNAGSAMKPMLPPGELAGSAPAFTLTDLNGKPVSLADFRGKVVVLNFWATWCPPCRREIPDFIDLQREYGSRGVQIVGIALDEPEKVQAFARQNGMNYPVLLGSDEISMKYGGIEGIPTTFIIDKDGKIVNRFEGFRPREVFEAEIKQLL
jgi:cytochrome c biogenesis protein CcmG/thiol:disulfide interchange protein DsbE